MVSMKKRILDHLGLKVLSLVIAIVVWIIVANVDDYTTTKQITGVEITFINGEAITEKNKVYEVPDGTTIDIVVKGRRSIVEKLSSEDFCAVADLSKMSVTNAVAINVSAVSSYIAKELTISYTDNAVNVAVENKLQKQLPITVRANSEVADGYAIRNKTASPNLITVEGAESVVNTIEEVVVDVDVKNASSSLSAYAMPVFLDKSGNEIDSSKFEYDVKEVEVSVEILKTKELKVRVKTTGEPKEGYAIAGIDYQPTSILVVGEAADLAKVDDILIDDIDVSDMGKDLEIPITLADYLPAGISLAEDTQEVMVKVAIEKVEEKMLVISGDEINIVGKADGMNYNFTENVSYTIKVKGLVRDLDDLKVTNLIPSIDVSGYGEGIYKFVVNFKEIKGITILESIETELEITQAP